jgi:hypothetical protein
LAVGRDELHCQSNSWLKVLQVIQKNMYCIKTVTENSVDDYVLIDPLVDDAVKGGDHC